jgi:hypothetical protein
VKEITTPVWWTATRDAAWQYITDNNLGYIARENSASVGVRPSSTGSGFDVYTITTSLEEGQ